MKRSSPLCAVWILVLAAVVGVDFAAAGEKVDLSRLPAAAKGKIDFVKQIQPIFRARCYSCHGSEADEGGLRLDVKLRAMDGSDNGPVILPGKSAESRLIHLVAGLVEDERMPPEDEGTPLATAEIALLRAWIDAGADWPSEADAPAGKIAGADHWSFQPIAQVKEPAVSNQAWVRNGIDAFVLRRLEAEGVRPSPEANRETLLRRLYLDLVGLPPTPEERDEFLADTSSGAYEQLVDRLLASSRYGERWARHWLDIARYADSDGFEKDRPRPHAWRWRDWVIGALNDDMPFNQFTVEQLAGDMLPGATLDQRVATGFHRNTLVNTEGGTDKEEDRVKRTVDRTNTMGAAWLGLTVQCSNCHSHKYDPLSQREYFGLYAFFNSMSEPDIPAPLPSDAAKYQTAKAAFDRKHATFVEAIKVYEATKLPAAQAAWEADQEKRPLVWSVLRPAKVESAKGSKLSVQKDGSVLAGGKNPASDIYMLECETDLARITGLRIEVLPDKSLPKMGPGRSSGGNFVLAELQVKAGSISAKGETRQVELDAPRADFSQKDWHIASAIDGNLEKGWAVSPQIGKPHTAVFETKTDVTHQGGCRLTITLNHNYNGQPHNLGRFRISVTDAERPIALDGLPADVAAALQVAATSRTAKQKVTLAKHFRTIDPGYQKLAKAAEAHAKQAPVDPGTKVKAQAVAEMPAPRTTKIHIRGDFLNKGAEVKPHTPAVLHPLKVRDPKKGPDRLDLANWIVDRDNPLTARVTVNRIWQHYFGRGIVPALHDFGTQGDPPSHPQLLDWLANEFRDNGWSLKRLHRLIVTSATYRQSSRARPELAQRDPYNALLARQRRLRVEAEVVRDLALAVSGLLHEEVGGPSVRPQQPAGIDKLGYANSVKWQTSKGTDRYRRGLYTFFQRTVPYPMLMTFDAPDSNLACTRRSRSNTPLQSLTLWNDPVFFECAQALGRRIVVESPAAKDARDVTAARIRYAFRLCLGREPDAEELRIVSGLFDRQLELAKADPAQAENIVGTTNRPAGTSAADLAGWVVVGRTLMNLDEFITKE